jgi:glycosyltransferase involved in cell wall biosynthesis
MAGVPGPLAIAYLGDPNSIHLRRWAGWFAGRGHRVALLVPEGLAVEPGLAPEIAIRRFEAGGGHPLRGPGMLSSGKSVRRALAAVRPEVLHVHHLTVHGFRAWTSGFHPYVVTVWGSDVLVTARKSRRARLLARLALRSADLVTGISAHVVEAAVELGAHADRSRVLHFGVDTGLFAPGQDPAALRARLGLKGRRVILSPRALAPNYRHDVVVDALERLPGDVALVMLDSSPEAAEAEAIRRRIADRGLLSRVIVAPAVPHRAMPDYYRLADVVVSVPESDAGPITLVEALAAGKPAVCSDLPPVREWLAGLDPACLVPIGDVAATAAAIGAVLERSASERDALAGRGRRMVLERADQERNMAEMEVLYRRLAAGLPANAAAGGPDSGRERR